MTDWIKHDGGPQPVADDVWVHVLTDHEVSSAGDIEWREIDRYRILNQHLIDAARLEGIRLGLNAAMAALLKLPNGYREAGVFLALDPETIAREAADKETAR